MLKREAILYEANEAEPRRHEDTKDTLDRIRWAEAPYTDVLPKERYVRINRLKAGWSTAGFGSPRVLLVEFGESAADVTDGEDP